MNFSAPNSHLLSVRSISVDFPVPRSILSRIRRDSRQVIRAVDEVSFDLPHGSVLAIVGESGSGKTTLARTILRLQVSASGRIFFDSRDITHVRGRQLRLMRRNIQMIPQDAEAGLSPRQTIAAQLTEPYVIHKIPRSERTPAGDLLELVGLSRDLAGKRPGEISGGQARRVAIARAIVLSPKLIVADEPTAGLDVSAAANALNVMLDLGERLGLTYLLITHDLSLVGSVANHIAVMYLGQLAEVGPAVEVLTRPRHPYTQALMSAIPAPDPDSRRREHRLLLPGEIPSIRTPPSGCRFHTRCPYATERCKESPPPREFSGEEHHLTCFWWREIAAGLKRAEGIGYEAASG